MEGLDTLKYGLDPTTFAERKLGITPDPWQADALMSKESMIFNCSRQSGKSTTAAIRALHEAVFYPGSQTLIISPSQRQSGELFRKVRELIYKIGEEMVEDSRTTATFPGGSRIISLPSSESTIRGYSAITLLLIDEASRVSDDIWTAVRPMLATTNGQIIMLSTPAGREGFFADAWENGKYKKFKVTAHECPRITEDFLKEEKEALGSMMFAQEYLCEFLDEAEGGMFKRAWADIVDEAPRGHRIARGWDMASSEEGDYTASCLMGTMNDHFYIVQVTNDHNTPGENERLLASTVRSDPPNTIIRMEQEPGSSGASIVDHYRRNIIPGKNFDGVRATGSKAQRAQPLSAAFEAGKVHLLKGDWNEPLIRQLCAFPLGEHDDMVDACAIAYNTLADRTTAERFRKMIIR